MLVVHYRDWGHNAYRIQFDTMQMILTFVFNYTHASYDGMGVMFTNSKGKSLRVSHASTNFFWFQQFILECHMRMGDVWGADIAVSIYVI